MSRRTHRGDGVATLLVLALLAVAATASALTVEEIVNFKAAGFSEEQIRTIATAAGSKLNLTDADVARLRAAGCSDALIAFLRGALVPAPTPASGPAPAPASAPARKPLPTQPVEIDGDTAVLRHVMKMFVLRYPKDWRLLQEIEDGRVQHAVSPEAGAATIKELGAALLVTIIPIDPESLAAGMEPAPFLKHMLPAVRAEEPGMTPVGEPAAAALGRLKGAKVAFEGTIKDKQGTFISELYMAMEEGYAYLVVLQYPKGEQAARKPALEKILADSQFGRPLPPRPDREFKPSDLTRLYKGSVFSISTETAFGTGFVISKDGYALTNWHVVWNSDKGSHCTDIYAHWDESLKRPTVKVEVVRSASRLSEEVFLGGVDVALLKLPPGEYTPIPLTELSQTELGDGVVAMGFPQQGRVGGTSLFLTNGVIVRYNRNAAGEVESVFHSAKITHGSSGGPCLSTVTGGVIGLNTWSQPIATGEESIDLNDMVGYYSVCTTDTAMTEFPLAVMLGRDPQGKDLSFIEAFELSTLLAGKGTGWASKRLAARATELLPDSADAYAQLGAGDMFMGERMDKPALAEQALAEFEKALTLDPDHQTALLLLVAHYTKAGDLKEALQYADRAVRAKPDNWGAYFYRAAVKGQAGKYAEAIADLREADRCAHSLLPQPYVSSGQFRYAAGQLDEGRADFQKACQLQPGNLDAQIGAAMYFEKKKEYDKAIEQYSKLLPPFQRHMDLLTRIGICHRAAGRIDEALKFYQEMINTAGERRRPTAEGLLDCGDILMTVKKNARGAAKIWGWYLKYYGDQRDAAYVHIKLAEAFINKDPSLSDWGIVYAHLRSAKAVAPDDPNVDELLRKATPTALSEADVLHLLKNVEYPPEVLAELCRHTVMGFRLDQATVRRLLDAGVPPIVLTAIDESLKKNPPISQAAGGDDKHDGRLIGLWLMVVTDNAGRRIGANGLEFRGKADKWACVNFIERDGAPDQQAEFTWETVDNKQFVVRDTANRVFKYPYQFADGKLVVTYPDGSKAVYTRSQPRPAGGNG